MVHSTLLLVPFLTAFVHAANDWTKPCFQGECFYDLPESDGSASGTLKIWGSPDAISDITAAAGWSILGCDKDALAQDIRLVCQSDDPNAGCNHLYQNIGAAGKIVRLPENCGKSAFARVARAWVPKDQSIPSNIARRIVRRAGETPEVQALALDTDFAAVDPAQSGDVNIAIQGATVPGANGNLTVTSPTSAPQRRSRFARRGLFDFIEDAFNKFNSFDKTVTADLPPIDVQNTIPIFEEKIPCPASGNIPAIDASIKAQAETKAHAIVQIGVATSGTIVPPNLDQFGVFAGLDATLDATMDLQCSASGTIDSGAIPLFQVGVPGLDFPGVLTIGPSFKILGQAKATLDVNVDMKVGMSYKISNAKLFFPSSSKQTSGGDFAPSDAPLKLSVSPSVASKGTLEAHIIPTLDLGINALGGTAKATVFLNLDASAAVTLTLEAGSTTTVTPRSSIDNVVDDGTAPVAKALIAVPRADTATTAGVSGCLDIGAALNVNAGADAKFFGAFDANTQVNLFSQKFDFFKKCLGSGVPKKREVSGRLRRLPVLYKRAGLTCSVGNSAPVSVVDESVPGTSIKVSGA